MGKQRIRYYDTEQTDFYEDGTAYTLPEDYRWVREDRLSRCLSGAIYAAALLFSTVYCRLFLHVRIRGAAKVRRVRAGFFFYGNHTQPVGDVFDPALACFPKRIYTVVSPANMALPGIGKILPYLGALPIPDTLQGMKAFSRAVAHRIEGGHPVIIYPEAHVWDYYTGIRPFPETAFKYPVKLGVPVFSFTTTYQKRRWGKRPAITIYVDGPFDMQGETPREQAVSLRDGVLAAMRRRSKESTYAYIEYRQAEERCE